MTDLTEKLKPSKRRALTAIMESKTIRDAAEACGLSEKTIYRYMADPLFKAALREAENEVIDGVNRKLVSYLEGVVMVMMSSCTRENPAGVRLRAAEAVRDTFIKMRELRTLEDRLSQLEAVIYGKQNN